MSTADRSALAPGPAEGGVAAGACDAERPADLVAVGESMVMLTPDPPAPLLDATALAIHVGGAESNVAMYLAELGYRARWASLVGDDPFGAIILRKLAASGVDVDLVDIVADARTGVYVKDPADGATTVYYFRHQSAASRLSPEFLTRRFRDRARVLHLSGVTAGLSSSALDLLRAALAERGRYAELTSFDVNYRPGLWSPDQAAPVLAELANRSDVAFVGLDEARTLWGCERAEDVREMIPGAARLVVKDGAFGAHSLNRDGTSFEPSLDVAVVEQVGAGDAFAAGYLAATLEGCPEWQRLRMGHLVASTALTVSSDHGPLPPGDELKRRRALDPQAWAQLRIESAAVDGFVRTGVERG